MDVFTPKKWKNEELPHEQIRTVILNFPLYLLIVAISNNKVVMYRQILTYDKWEKQFQKYFKLNDSYQ